MSLLCGTAVFSGLCDEVRGSDVQRERLAELLLLHVESSRRLGYLTNTPHWGETPGWAGNV